MLHVSEGRYICTKTGFILVQGVVMIEDKGLCVCHRTRAYVCVTRQGLVCVTGQGLMCVSQDKG